MHLPHTRTHSHFLHQAALYVYSTTSHNLDGQPTLRAVILDQPTAFTMNEMSGSSSLGRIGSRPLFMGGETGNDSAILLHKHVELSPPSQEILRAGAVTRIFEGGLPLASSCVDAGIYDGDMDLGVDDDENGFKFFFNYVEITHKEIEEINSQFKTKVAGIQVEEEEKRDVFEGWMCVDFDDADVVLNNRYERGECWKMLRNKLKSSSVATDGWTI
ncbi:hypothetical protein TL16_g04566 [Triparma laevis f. inornata]|uniref:Uncharacterized protein n=1 Tax=Triparma laevis f. inornata TaxID=1714386 RepID=A0A9W7E8T8_9STRA|nr:hypothetical protein TL16_g04566 [Triparma laevis f. inornata]